MESVLLVVIGALALGLPHASSKDRRRFWHPWLENGLAPFLLGALILPLLFTSFEPRALHNMESSIRALLIIALTAAGVLAGTQLRAAYITRAGSAFLAKQSFAAGLQGLGVFVPVFLILAFMTNLLWVEIFGAACLLSAFAMASSQRPMKSAKLSRHRAVIVGHVVSTGWWNLLAMVAAAIGVALCIVPMQISSEILLAGLSSWEAQAAASLGTVLSTWLIWLGVPLLLGIILGRLAVKAHSRDEAYVFLIAIIIICGGISVAKGGSPLLSGLVLGAAFVNVSLARSALVERALEDLEQPVVVATGLFAGLCLHLQAAPWSWLWFGIAALVIVVRVAYRAYQSPSSNQVSMRSERMLASPGATGVLLVGSLVLIPGSGGVAHLVQPFILALFALTVADEWWGRWVLRKLRHRASESVV